MRKGCFLFLLLFCCLVFSCGGEKAEEPEAAVSPTPLPINNEFAYYQSIETDGSFRLIGKNPVKAESIQYVKCYHFVYDDEQRIAEIEYLHKGQPAVDSLFKVHKLTMNYADRYETRSFFDLEGKPVAGAAGIFAYRLTYDAQGRLLELLNLDRDNKPHADEKDIVQTAWKYDDFGNLIENSYLDGEGRPRRSGPDRVAILRHRYDSKGRVIEKSFHDAEEQPTPNAQGVAIVRYQYNEMDHLVEIANYDAAGQAVDSSTGVAKTVFHYDEKGQYLSTERFTKIGKLLTVSTKSPS